MVIESIAESRVKQVTYGGFVSMDCRKSKAKEARSFQSLVSISQKAILSSQPSMSLYCHMIYAFLCKKTCKDKLYTARIDFCPQFGGRHLISLQFTDKCAHLSN